MLRYANVPASRVFHVLSAMCAEFDGGQSQRGTGTRDPDKRGGEAEVPVRESASPEYQRPKPSAAAGKPAPEDF